MRTGCRLHAFCLAKKGATNLILFENCILVPTPSPFSAEELGLSFFEGTKSLARFLSSAGASSLHTLA